MSGPPPPEPAERRRGRWVAIVTGAISVLVGVLYLLLIVLLDSRGPLQPPPPEALAPAGAALPPAALSADRGGASRSGAATADPGAAGVRPPG